MEQYQDLMDAVSIIKTARLAEYTQNGPSPAWEMLADAVTYLQRQASETMRGGL